MKQLTMKLKFLFLALIVSITLPMVLNAQPMPDSNDVDTPIDGGITLLIAAGAVIGTKKIKNNRKKF